MNSPDIASLGKEPVVIRTTALLAFPFAAVLAVSPAVCAGAHPEAPPTIDWRDFVDDMSEGDHVVGEEICARPRASESHAGPYTTSQ